MHAWHTLIHMANSKYSYVKHFETDDGLLPDCWIVVRVDGKGFTKCVGCILQRPIAGCRLTLDAACTAVRQVVNMCTFTDTQILCRPWLREAQ